MEQVGASYVGKTSDSQLITSTSMCSFTPVVIEGNQAATYPKGAAMINDAATGFKKRYVVGGATTGACILVEAVTTTVGGGNVTTDGFIEGNIDESSVVCSTGGAIDAGFKAALPKVRFE